jgi:hypothetical protein
MRRPPAVRLALALALVLAPSFRALAQAVVAAQPASTAPARDGKALKSLSLSDYGRWNRITSATISPDGKWMTYALQPNEGDATL